MYRKMVTAFEVVILTLMMLLTTALLAPTQQSEDADTRLSAAENETNSSIVPETPEQSMEQPTQEAARNENITHAPVLNSCPGYQTGNPALRNRTGCLTGAVLDPVDHEMAFGFNNGGNPDWSTCGIPRVPQANERVCYRTTVDQCGSNYRVFLNHRDESRLQRQCPSESENLATSDSSQRYLQSPRYGCRKGRGSGSLHRYRRSDLCLYNISIPDCESGWVIIESSSGNDHQIEEQMRDDAGNLICTDYLQIFYGESKTERFCDNHLTLNLPLNIRATQFLVVFWTDPSTNDLGFKLRASCRQT